MSGARAIRETQLLSGPTHASWECRFGHTHYRAGTEFYFPSPSLSKWDEASGQTTEIKKRAVGRPGGENILGVETVAFETDHTDPYGDERRGEFSYFVAIGTKELEIRGSVVVQQAALFSFDDRNTHHGVTLSADKKTVGYCQVIFFYICLT